MDADGRLLCAHNLSRSALDQIYGTSKEGGMSTYVWRPSHPPLLPPLHFTVARCSFFFSRLGRRKKPPASLLDLDRNNRGGGV